jgi:serine/threonine-protein kinase
MSYPRLVELFATGKVGHKTLIARESTRFKTPETFPELARFVTSPALRWEDDFPKDAVSRGPIDRATLPAYLFRFALARATGMLALAGSDQRKKIYLVEGVPEFVASTDKRELLGEHLIARGQVLRMEVEMALAMLPRFGGRIGDALVGLGVLRPIELFRAIHEQTQERYVAIFRWVEGEIGFVEGARSQEETFPLGVDPFDLIARGVRTGYASGELRGLLAKIGDALVESVASPPVRLESFRLTEREAGVLRATAARPIPLARLIAERCVHGEADVEEVLRAVFLGLSCGLLRCAAWGTGG